MRVLLTACFIVFLVIESRAVQPAAGWQAGKDTTLSIADGELRIETLGRDPWVSTKDVPRVAGPFMLELGMKTTAKGPAQVFFTQNVKDGFGRATTVEFDTTPDESFHDYKVPLQAPKGIFALRIDPAKSPGSSIIRSLVLRDAKGIAVKTWSFEAPRKVSVKSGKEMNVLLLLIEDQGAHLGCLGTPGLSTPHMDALAQDGVLFSQYYVGYPVCSPSKACMYSGLYPHRNGLINNTHNIFKPASELTAAERSNTAYAKNQINPAVTTLAEILHQRGYHMGVSGKLHVSPNEKFPYDEFIRGKNIVGSFIEGAKATGRPWFLFDNAHGEPHRPFIDSDKQKIAVDPAKVRLPAFLPDTSVCRQDWAEYLNGIQLADAEVGRAMADLKASGQLDNTLVLVMAGDHGPAFQHGKMTPYELGLHVNLLVRAPGGARGLMSDALSSEVDILPTILDYLGVAVPSGIDGVSLRAIIEGRAGAKTHDYVFAEVSGRTPGGKRGMEERSVIDGRWHLIVRTRLDEPRVCGADSWQFPTWRNRSYRETIRVKGEFPIQYRILTEMDPAKLGGTPPVFELYDLQTDRDEMKNLASDPAHRAELERLFAALKTWSVETKDVDAPLPDLK